MKTTHQKQYAEWLEGMNYNYTATIRSIYPLTQTKLDRYSNTLLKLNPNIENIYSVIEPDTDPYSKAQDLEESYITKKHTTGNHAHLLIKTCRPQPYLTSTTNAYRPPYTIPYYEEIRDLKKITNYIVKYQTENNYNINIR